MTRRRPATAGRGRDFEQLHDTSRRGGFRRRWHAAGPRLVPGPPRTLRRRSRHEPEPVQSAAVCIWRGGSRREPHALHPRRCGRLAGERLLGRPHPAHRARRLGGAGSATTLFLPCILIGLYAVRGYQLYRGDRRAASRILWLHGVGAVVAIFQAMSGILVVMQVIKVAIHVFGGVTALLALRALGRHADRASTRPEC